MFRPALRENFARTAGPTNTQRFPKKAKLASRVVADTKDNLCLESTAPDQSLQRASSDKKIDDSETRIPSKLRTPSLYRVPDPATTTSVSRNTRCINANKLMLESTNISSMRPMLPRSDSSAASLDSTCQLASYRCIWSASCWQPPGSPSTFQYYVRASTPKAARSTRFCRLFEAQHSSSELIQKATACIRDNRWASSHVLQRGACDPVEPVAGDKHDQVEILGATLRFKNRAAFAYEKATRERRLGHFQAPTLRKPGARNRWVAPKRTRETIELEGRWPIKSRHVSIEAPQNDTEHRQKALDRGGHLFRGVTSVRNDFIKHDGTERAESQLQGQYEPSAQCTDLTCIPRLSGDASGGEQRMERILAPEEMAQIGRVFREVFLEPPSALSSIPGEGICLERITPEAVHWWNDTCRSRSETWFQRWHAFVQFVRQRLANTMRPGYRLNARRVRRWLAQFVRQVRSSDAAKCGRMIADPNHDAREGQSKQRAPRNCHSEDRILIRGIEPKKRRPCRQHQRQTTPVEYDLISLPPGSDIDQLLNGARQRLPRNRLCLPVTRAPVWIHGLPSQGCGRWPGFIVASIDAGLDDGRSSVPHVIIQAANSESSSQRCGILFAVPQRQIEPFELNDLETVLAEERAHRRSGSRHRIRFEQAVAEVCSRLRGEQVVHHTFSHSS